MGKEQVDELVQQFIEQNKEQLPELLKLRKDIRTEFQEVKASQGIHVAILTAYQTIDSIYKASFADCADLISCIGCTAAYCCHQTVLICEAEAALIAQYCKENKIKISRKYLIKQLNHNRENIGRADCSACVFLKDNRCSIYPVRPGTCRNHHATTPIEYCDIKSYEPIKIGFINNPSAQIIAVVICEEGGKVDRMPRLLLKYSQ